jgi:hypothetical protein
VRIQEQLAAMFILDCSDVEIVDSSIERIGTRIKGEFHAIQADGMTLNRTTNIIVRGCRMESTWEAIDFTGASGSDFLFEDCTVVDSFASGYKVAHPKQNGRLVNCVAVRSGMVGFLIGEHSENIELLNCKALETGYPTYWQRSDGTRSPNSTGFRIDAADPGAPIPNNIRLESCAAINEQHPEAMEYGILCLPDPAGRNITMSDFEARGATLGATRGMGE